MLVLSHLTGVLDSLGLPQCISVERRDGATVDGIGNAVPGILTVFTVARAVIQPLSGRDLERLLDGDRSKEMILVHSKTNLRTAREASGQEADVILFDEPTPTPAGILSGRYTVTKAANWQLVAGFTNVIATKQESDLP